MFYIFFLTPTLKLVFNSILWISAAVHHLVIWALTIIIQARLLFNQMSC